MLWMIRVAGFQGFHVLGWLLLISMPAVAAQSSVLVVGDSLSAAHNIPVERGWVHLLEQRMKNEIPDPPAVINASISGETSAGALTRLPNLLSRHKPGWVVIELGGNDALRGLSLRQLQDNLDRMVALSQAAGAKVVILGIDVPPNYGRPYRDRLRAVYRDVAQARRETLVPFFLEGVALDPELMQADGIHPNENAQSRLLDTVWTALRPLLST